MLSRLALRKVQALPAMSRATQIMSSSTTTSAEEDYRSTTPWKRPVRAEFSGKVRFGFVPDEWFTIFYPKTGVTGPYMFYFGVATWMLSKEIYVIEHEFYSGCSLALILIYITKKYGKDIGAYLDTHIENQVSGLYESRNSEIAHHESTLAEIKDAKWRIEAQPMIYDAKKEGIKMQLEAAYRARLANVYNEVKKRLDFQVRMITLERQFQQKHMADWIVENVKAALTPDVQKATMLNCIKDLQGLAAAAKA